MSLRIIRKVKKYAVVSKYGYCYIVRDKKWKQYIKRKHQWQTSLGANYFQKDWSNFMHPDDFLIDMITQGKARTDADDMRWLLQKVETLFFMNKEKDKQIKLDKEEKERLREKIAQLEIQSSIVDVDISSLRRLYA